MRFLERLLARVIDMTSALSAIAVLLMMVHITADVVGKFVFNSPLPGTISIVSEYYMVVVAFLPLALVERHNGHISVEVLTEKMPMRVQQHLGAFGTLLSAVIFALLTWRSFGQAMSKYGSGTFSYEQGVKILTWPSYFLLPAGTALMTLVLIYKLARYLRGGENSQTWDRFSMDPAPKSDLTGD